MTPRTAMSLLGQGPRGEAGRRRGQSLSSVQGRLDVGHLGDIQGGGSGTSCNGNSAEGVGGTTCEPEQRGGGKLGESATVRRSTGPGGSPTPPSPVGLLPAESWEGRRNRREGCYSGREKNTS